MSRVHRQVQLGFLAVPAGLVLQLLTMLLIASHLGPARFGVYAVIMGIVNIAIFVMSMGLGTILTKLVAEEKQPPSEYVAVALPLATAFAAACGLVLIGIVAVAYGHTNAAAAGVVAAINILAFGPSVVFSATLRGMQQIEKWMIWFIAHKAVALVFVLVAVRPLGGGITLALAAWTVANVLTMGYACVALWGPAWRGQMRWNIAELRSLVSGSVTVGLTAASTRLAMEMENFILAFLMPDHVVGVFAAGKRVINPVGQVLNGAVSIPTFPGLCRLANEDRQEFAHWATKLCSIQWIAGLALALGAMVAAPYLVPLLLRGDYGDSVHVIQITVWSLAPALLSNQLRYVYIALSREAKYLKLSVVYLVLKAGLLAVLTWRYGLWGACWGTVVSELGLALIVRLGVKGLNVQLRMAWQNSIPTVLAIGLLLVAWRLEHNVIIPFAIAGLGGLVALYVVFRLLRSVREHIPPAAEQPATDAEPLGK